MTSSLYLPTDSVTGRAIDFDLAADFLELAAFFSADSTVATSDLANTASIAAAEDHVDLEDEIDNGEEEIVSGAVNRLDLRARVAVSQHSSEDRTTSSWTSIGQRLQDTPPLFSHGVHGGHLFIPPRRGSPLQERCQGCRGSVDRSKSATSGAGLPAGHRWVDDSA